MKLGAGGGTRSLAWGLAGERRGLGATKLCCRGQTDGAEKEDVASWFMDVVRKPSMSSAAGGKVSSAELRFRLPPLPVKVG